MRLSIVDMQHDLNSKAQKAIPDSVSIIAFEQFICIHFVVFGTFFRYSVFTRESSYCFQRVIAIAILSVRLSVCHTGGSVKSSARENHQIFTVGYLEDSSFTNRKAFL